MKQKASKMFPFPNSTLEKMTWLMQWHKVRYKEEHTIQISTRLMIDFSFPSELSLHCES